MVQVTVPTFPPTLADLSRNASVISSSSDTDLETTSSALLRTPRPRPVRTFSSPRSPSPQSPTVPACRPPNYLTRELGVTRYPSVEPLQVQQHAKERSKSRRRSREPGRARSSNSRLGAQEFLFGDTLGEGSYSTVMRARYIRTGQEYAIKILDKNHLIRKEKMLVAVVERNVLVKLGAGHPGIVHLHWTFQDEWSLFFVLDLAHNGEMQSCISRLGSLSLACSRYFAAQIVDALEYMHGKDVIHRDLKPENLLLDAEFRIKITDFGTGKILENNTERANTFVGTAQYVAPELLESNETSKSSDLWSLGCIIYQMISGRFAFQGLSEYLTWQKIKYLDYTFPDGFDEDAKDLVRLLLVRDPTQRLGAGSFDSAHSYAALRAHPFFASVSWDTLWTDPAPPLEAGLVKKEPQMAGVVEEGQWDDVGEAWDRLVGGNGDVGVENADGVGWAEDGEGTEFQQFKARHASSEYVEEGPRGEVSDCLMWQSKAEERGTPRPQDAEETSTVVARGRNHVETPVQGNGPSSSADWTSLLLPSERILFHTRIEARSPKRRGSKLRLPISASLSKTKTRQLVLTSMRLLCVKPKNGGEVSLKSEAGLSAGEKGKERDRPKEKERDAAKDVRDVIESAEPKGEREFVILTSTRSQTYAAETSDASALWVEKINEALAQARNDETTRGEIDI